MVKFIFSLFFLQHPYVEPPEYYDSSDFCPTCDTLEFYITALVCLVLVIILTKIKKLNKESFRKICYLIASLILFHLLFFRDYPTLCIISGAFAIFFILGFLSIIAFVFYILIGIIFKRAINLFNKS